MAAPELFTISTTGTVPDESRREQVIAAFAELFKVSEEKAGTYFQGKPELLRRGLNADSLEKFTTALEEAGIPFEVQSGPARTSLNLELVPQEGQEQEKAAADFMICPKCLANQPPALQCRECGIVVEKYRQANRDNARAAPARPPVRGEEKPPGDEAEASAVTVVSAGDSASLVAIGAAAVTALLGAWLWQAVAVGIGYEFGLIAWGIGGAVGLAAVLCGGKGQVCGVLCGALALASIMGGKYFTMESFKEEFTSALVNEQMWGEDGQALFEELKDDAAAFRELDGSEESLRIFLVDHGYSEAMAPGEVSQEEIDTFFEYDRENLEWLSYGEPTYEEWQQQAVASIEEISSGDLVMADFGILDALFIILGIGTAFRLGSGFSQA